MHRIRNCRIDAFRGLAILAIISVHTPPFKWLPDLEFWHYIIDNLCRFAVPFFFLISGYFFGKSLQKKISLGKLLWEYTKKIGILFISWSVIYAFIPTNIVRRAWNQGLVDGVFNLDQFWRTIEWIAIHPKAALLQGTKIHLWFLISLLLSLALVSFFIWIRKERYLLVFAFLLYVASLIGTHYEGVFPSGSFAFSPPNRNGPFFSLFFVSFGWFVGRAKKHPKFILHPWILIFIGLMMLLVESIVLWKYFGQNPRHDFLFGTILFGVGVFGLALKKTDKSKNVTLAPIGVLAGGIYLSHFYMIDVVRMLRPFFDPILWQVLFPVLVLVSSCGLVILLKNFRITSVLVTGKCK